MDDNGYMESPSARRVYSRRVSDVSGALHRVFGDVYMGARKGMNMLQVVKAVNETQKFYLDVERNRKHELAELEKENAEKEDKDLPPVFNKRLFVTQGAVIITRQAKKIMGRNARLPPESDPMLTKTELQNMRTVVEGLKLVHKGHDYIKDVLARSATLETYDAFQYVVKKHWEDYLSCYYIVHGAVEVTYDMNAAAQSSSRNVYQPNIIYSHGTGEFLGMVSAEGKDEDIAPPATVYTKEHCEFIRIDRERFHRLAEKEESVLGSEIKTYLKCGDSILSRIPNETQAKILHLIEKQEYPPNRTILNQRESSDYIYVIVSGRCQCLREVYIPEAEKPVLFYLCCLENDEFFGEECILDNVGSHYKIVTSTNTVCYKLHRTALKIVNFDKLTRIIEENRHEFVPDDELRNRGYKNCVWNNFKHSKVKESLKEQGKLKYLSRGEEERVTERPPSAELMTRENMYRFVLKGSQYTPFRIKSASARLCPTGQSSRPRTASSKSNAGEEGDNGSSSGEDSDADDFVDDRHNSRLITADMANTLDRLYSKDQKEKLYVHIRKSLDSKENILNLMDENSELGRHLKSAWESENSDQSEQSGFMKNSVLVMMQSDDIVRKAMAQADKQSYQQRRRSTKQEDEWNTILHAENKQAKFLITANKMRINVLRKKLDEIDKQRKINTMKRNRERSKRYPNDGSKERDEAKEREEKEKRTFFLDRLSTLRARPKEDLRMDTAVASNAALFISKTKRLAEKKTKDDSAIQSIELSEEKKVIRPSSAIVTKSEEDSYESNQQSLKGSKRRFSSSSSVHSISTSSGSSASLSQRQTIGRKI